MSSTSNLSGCCLAAGHKDCYPQDCCFGRYFGLLHLQIAMTPLATSHAAMPRLGVSALRRAVRATLAATLLLPLAMAAPGFAADVLFEGKPLKIIAGMPVGGGVDAYARLVQKHLQRFLPGAPPIIVQNVPGAGSLRSV